MDAININIFDSHGAHGMFLLPQNTKSALNRICSEPGLVKTPCRPWHLGEDDATKLHKAYKKKIPFFRSYTHIPPTPHPGDAGMHLAPTSPSPASMHLAPKLPPTPACQYASCPVLRTLAVPTCILPQAHPEALPGSATAMPRQCCSKPLRCHGRALAVP